MRSLPVAIVLAFATEVLGIVATHGQVGPCGPTTTLAFVFMLAHLPFSLPLLLLPGPLRDLAVRWASSRAWRSGWLSGSPCCGFCDE
jgi:hypothetical protein